MTDLEKQFDQDMLEIYKLAKKECGYNATRFLQMISSQGGLETARNLIRNPDSSVGFSALFEHNRLDLSVEAHVLKPVYSDLFSEEERQMCRDKLAQFKYKVE